MATWTIYFPALAPAEYPLPRGLTLFIEEMAQAEPANVKRRLKSDLPARCHNVIGRRVTANF